MYSFSVSSSLLNHTPFIHRSWSPTLSPPPFIITIYNFSTLFFYIPYHTYSY
ncbi:hypothetical protein BC941DRAFT_419212 [Chlamydoabsidia padenii]|nr:hypothetical protein BC941DRAFT_419212 [Chlamydoabsidia padenii]